jgi:hypothetical protein
MKNILCILLAVIILLSFYSCVDNSTDPKTTSFKKMKISVYVYDSDSSKFLLETEQYFDGDLAGFPKRTYQQMFGESNYQSELVSSVSNVPLPVYKYGCPIKDIFFEGGIQYLETTYEYDGDGYLTKMITKSNDNYSYNSAILQKVSNNLYIFNIYEDDELTEILKRYLDNNGLCILEVDSTPNQNDNFYTYYNYNSKRQKIYEFITQNNVNGDIFNYYYDDEGNNIKMNLYSIYQGDTTYSYSRERIMYKGYLVDPELIEYLEFDSGNNIIGYTYVDDFWNKKYKITYEYY